MSTEEVAAVAPATMVEDQPSSVAAPSTKKAKAKSSKSKAPSKPRAPLAHPPYAEMIGEAITTLKERTGSSQHAITKFIEDRHKSKLSSNFKKIVLLQLKKLTAAGKLTKVKASYKLSLSATKTKKSAAKPKAKTAAKPKAKTAVKPKKAAASAKKPVAPATKKSATATKTKRAAPKPKPKVPAVKVAKKSVKDTPSKKKVVATAKKAAPAKNATTVKKNLVKKAAPVKKAAVGKGKK